MSATSTHRGKPNCTVTQAAHLQQQRNDATTVGNSREQSNSEAQQSRETKATAKTNADENDVCNRIQQPSLNQKPGASAPSISNGKKQDQSQHQKKHGKLPTQSICRRKLIQVPTVTTNAVCGTTCTVWTKIRIAIRLQTSVVC